MNLRSSRPLIVLVAAACIGVASGCVVVKPVVGVGAAAAGAAVKTTAKAAGAVGGAVIPDGEKPDPKENR